MKKIFWTVLLLTGCLMMGACGREMSEAGETNETGQTSGAGEKNMAGNTNGAGRTNEADETNKDGETKSEEIATQNSADYPFYATAQELVEAADLIFSGSVESVTYEVLDVRTESGTDSLTGSSEAQGILYTLYEIKVSEVYKGTFEGDTLTVKCPGGEVDGSLHISNGTSTISQRGTYLFLTATYENTYPSLLNADQACYDMNLPEAVNEENNGAITLSQILEALGGIVF